MKKILAMLFVTALSSQAWSIMINDGGVFDGTDVGALDTLVATTTNLKSINSSCPNGSNPTAEACWAKSVTGLDYIYEGKTESSQAYETEGTNIIAFQLFFGPGSYIVKNSTSWALFTNLANLNWGVIDTGALGSGFNLSGDSIIISHVTEFDKSSTSVPEPSSIVLLSLGLLGVGFMRKKYS